MKIGIIGCGIVGSAIAYTLSKIPDLEVLVYDGRSPDQLESTGAALGVLMAALSSKIKGKHLKLCLDSLKLYDPLVAELVQQTQIEIPYNREGILQLVFTAEDMVRAYTAQSVRQKQEFQLEVLEHNQLKEQFPEFAIAHSLDLNASVLGAIYSPQDRQLNPTVLTQVLIQGAQQQGAQFHFGHPVVAFQTQQSNSKNQVTHLCTDTEAIPVDWVVVAAGLGSTPLTQHLNQPISIEPVLGQALHLRCPNPIRFPGPVINGCDVFLVPLNDHELWVGATVEFPDGKTDMSTVIDPQKLEHLRQQAIALYPALAQSEILDTWQGLRPRPNERAAPVIEQLPNHSNVLIATGHYRNGVLLAPITAQKVQILLQNARF